MFKGVLMISGVLAVRPEYVEVRSQEDKRIKESKTACGTEAVQDNIENSFIVKTGTGPSWFTNFILKTVWGEYAPNLTSPLVQLNDPALPHLLVGCKNELFGLRLLDVFFASRQFMEKVQRITGKPAVYVEVDSDHWRILNSTALRETLRIELPKLIAAS